MIAYQLAKLKTDVASPSQAFLFSFIIREMPLDGAWAYNSRDGHVKAWAGPGKKSSTAREPSRVASRCRPEGTQVFKLGKLAKLRLLATEAKTPNQRQITMICLDNAVNTEKLVIPASQFLVGYRFMILVSIARTGLTVIEAIEPAMV